jgi:Domain of unknown function (DUF5655)
MARTRSWKESRVDYARLLKERTGASVEVWNRRIKKARLSSPGALRAWLSERGVTGYAQSLLVMERFGYPDFLVASAQELIDAQYADRPQLRPILDAIVGAAAKFGEVTVQARKTYVSLVTTRRTFARVQATTKDRVDLALRLNAAKPTGRLKPSRVHEGMSVSIPLTSEKEFDSEARAWLRRAYAENG